MIEDILQSAKQTALERLSSPLLGSFLLSWLVWNWKFLVILFSENSVTTTFDLVNTLAFPDKTTLFLKGFFYPLLSSLAYVFLYPYPARFVYAFTLKRQRELNAIKQRTTDETLLTEKESRQLRADFIAHDRRSTEIIQKLTEENISLKAALDSKSKSTDPEFLSKTDQPYDRLKPSQLRLLRILGKFGEPVHLTDLIAKAGNEKIQTEFDIVELMRWKLLERRSTATGSKINLTHEGRRTLLDNQESSRET